MAWDHFGSRFFGVHMTAFVLPTLHSLDYFAPKRGTVAVRLLRYIYGILCFVRPHQWAPRFAFWHPLPLSDTSSEEGGVLWPSRVG